MKFLFHEAAERELEDALDFYERQQAGLGLRFFAEIEAALRQISENPVVWERMDEQTHRCLTNRFPYAVIYRLRPDTISAFWRSCICEEILIAGKVVWSFEPCSVGSSPINH